MPTRVSAQSYKIEGLRGLLDKIASSVGQVKVSKPSSISTRHFGRIRQTEIVTKKMWNRLISVYGGDFSREFAAITPREWVDDLQRSFIGQNDEVVFEIGKNIHTQRGPYTFSERLKGSPGFLSLRATNAEGESIFVKTIEVLKGEAFSSSWEARRAKLDEEFTREYENQHKLFEVEGIAHVIHAGRAKVKNIPYRIPYLVQQFIDGQNLLHYIVKRSVRLNPLSVDELLRIIRKLFSIIQEVHARGVIHGDICPENIILSPTRGVTLVDFGQSFLFEVHFRKHSEVIPSQKSTYAAPERLPGGKWSRPADIYSLGAVTFFLATGKPPPAHMRDNYKLKDEVFETLKEHNPKLLLENECVADVILRCLHFHIEDRANTASEIIDLIDILQKAGLADVVSTDEFEEEILQVQKDINRLESSINRIFQPFILESIRAVRRTLTDIQSGRFVPVVGDREEMIRGIMRYLALLRSGDEYYTLTIPSFWSSQNLGTDGRFLRLNKLIAKRGVTIRRVFLVTEAEIADEDVSKVLEAQQKAMQEVPVEIRKDDWNPSFGGFYTGFVVVSPSERDKLIRYGHHVGIAKSGPEYISLQFKAKNSDGQVRRLELRKEAEEPQTLLKDILFYLEKSTAIKSL